MHIRQAILDWYSRSSLGGCGVFQNIFGVSCFFFFFLKQVKPHSWQCPYSKCLSANECSATVDRQFPSGKCRIHGAQSTIIYIEEH